MGAHVLLGVFAEAVPHVLQGYVHRADGEQLEQAGGGRVGGQEVVVGDYPYVGCVPAQVARRSRALARSEDGRPLHLGGGDRFIGGGEPDGVVAGPQVAHVGAGRPGVDQVGLAVLVAADGVGDQSVVGPHRQLLDAGPAGVGDPRVDVVVASPSFGASQDLDDSVVGGAVISVVEGEQGRVVDDLIERGDAVLVGQALVGQNALQTSGAHLESDGGYVVADQGSVGHGAGHEAVVVGEPAVDPEVELAVGHRYVGVGRGQFQVGRVGYFVAELSQQGGVDGGLHVAGGPIGPRHRHRYSVAGAGGGRRHGFFGLRHGRRQGCFGLRHGGCCCGGRLLGCGLGLFQLGLGRFVAGRGRCFGGCCCGGRLLGCGLGLFQLGLGRRQLGAGLLGGAGVHDRDRNGGRRGGGRVVCGLAAGRRQQPQRRQRCYRGSSSSRHRNRPPSPAPCPSR